ncbi:MAG TPA: GTP-binding protein [candidate division Zixibacteria bacterium]|nr:GTP-binding protein [candidate division Zixibacteria bacterium]
MARLIWKIVIIGDPAVGKTSIRRRYLGETTLKEYIYTIGADFATKRIKLSDNLTVQYQIFDLAGQQKFDKVRSTFYSGAQAAVLVYDITDNNTLLNLQKWVKEAKRNSNGSLQTFVVVGNKIDLIEKKESDDETLKKFLQDLSKEMEHGILHIYTSALTGENIDLLFQKITEKLLHEAGKESDHIAKLITELEKIQLEKEELEKVPKLKTEVVKEEITEVSTLKRIKTLELEVSNLSSEIREVQDDLLNIKGLLIRYIQGMKRLMGDFEHFEKK